MSQYRNNRIARVGDRVIGTYGSSVVMATLQDVESGTAFIHEPSRNVVAKIDAGNFFLLEDALAASNSVNNKIAQSAPVAPVAATPAPQPIAVVAPPAAPAAPREQLAGWPTA